MIKKILYPTDFSEASQAALEYAIGMQKQFNAELIILHVLYSEGNMLSSYVSQKMIQGFMREMVDGAKEKLESYIAECESLRGVKVTTKLLTGVPYIEITNFVEENNIDLLVIGTRGRSGIEQVLFGSTTEKVIGHAKCPVLTINNRYTYKAE